MLFGPRLPSFPFVSQLFKAAPLIGSSLGAVWGCDAGREAEAERGCP